MPSMPRSIFNCRSTPLDWDTPKIFIAPTLIVVLAACSFAENRDVDALQTAERAFHVRKLLVLPDRLFGAGYGRRDIGADRVNAVEAGVTVNVVLNARSKVNE